MSKDMKDSLAWCGMVALTIILINCIGCTSAVYEAPIINGMLTPPKLGTTVCSENNQPVIVISEMPIPQELRSVVVYHEQIHARQMRSGCKAFAFRFRNDKTFRVANELEAYCQSVPFAVRQGFVRDSMIVEVERVMSFYYDTLVSCGGKNARNSAVADGTYTLPKREVSRRTSVPSLRDPP